MIARALPVLATIFVISPLARAQEATLPGEAPDSAGSPQLDHGSDKSHRAWRHASHGFGLRGSFGRALTEGVADGWYGRLEMDGFFARAPRSTGFVGGSTMGFEGWLADDAGGGALPASFYVGFRARPLFVSIGVGANLLMLDRVEGDTGFGVFAPFGTAALGIELPGLRVLADARAIYRWQWASDDRPQLQLGITLEPWFETRASGRWQRQTAMGSL